MTSGGVLRLGPLGTGAERNQHRHTSGAVSAIWRSERAARLTVERQLSCATSPTNMHNISRIPNPHLYSGGPIAGHSKLRRRGIRLVPDKSASIRRPPGALSRAHRAPRLEVVGARRRETDLRKSDRGVCSVAPIVAPHR
jgi:hypothetical protein